MNPADPRHPWQRLVIAARRAPNSGETAAPYGFATRVAALAMAQEPRPASLLARFSLRAAGVACLLMAAAFAANYSFPGNAPEDEGAVPGDAVTEAINAAS